MSEKIETVVIGAGAAGLACAGSLTGPAVVLEKNARPGLKILISGGGRCNFTNTGAEPGNYVSGNPHFSRSALARWTAADTVDWVTAAGIPWHEKHRGQLFCDNSSKDILNLLIRECTAAGHEVRCGWAVEGLEAIADGEYRVRTSRGDLVCRNVVVASGGLSYPRLGVSDVGYRIARGLGLSVTNTRPGLVGLRLERTAVDPDLAGVALPVRVRSGDMTFEEDLLFTHAGLSGPAILQISNYWAAGGTLSVDLMPSVRVRSLLEDGSLRDRDVANALGTVLPKALARSVSRITGLSGRKVRQLQEPHLAMIEAAVHDWCPAARETEGWSKAEVTIGGVETAGLSSKTFEARGFEGLHFIGEVVDVTGWLGGYNFQWAFASGRAAAEAVNARQ